MFSRRSIFVHSVAILCTLIAHASFTQLSFSAEPTKKRVLLIAGKPSHGYAEHEHNAGCMLLAKCLNESGLPIEAVVQKNGWPTDPKMFDGVAAVVMYCDGGKGHMVMDHLDELNELAVKGVGIGAIHYGVEVPKGKSGDYFLNWMGGYFEENWSVNPTWEAEFKELPKHAVTQGVKPFKTRDEWYFHMRMPESSDRVTPILTAVPPIGTMSRPDGPHEGNPAVRKAVADGLPQHMCWVVERPDGGRGFGFTGGHYHWNWGKDAMRKLALNLICWTAKVDLPADGVPTKPQTADDLLENLDNKPNRKGVTKANVQEILDQWKSESKSE